MIQVFLCLNKDFFAVSIFLFLILFVTRARRTKGNGIIFPMWSFDGSSTQQAEGND